MSCTSKTHNPTLGPISANGRVRPVADGVHQPGLLREVEAAQEPPKGRRASVCSPCPCYLSIPFATILKPP